MESMKEAWHNHPYIIMGLGAIIVAYFFWPSKTATQSGNAGDSQLAAETALAQTQLAEQAQTNQAQIAATAAQNAAEATAAGVSNQAVAAANAAAIVSYNQTTQTGINANRDVTISWLNGENSDFLSLSKGLTDFGAQSQGGAKVAAQTGLWGFLSALGVKFSANQDGINVDTAAAASQYAHTYQYSSNSDTAEGTQSGGGGGGGGGFGAFFGHSLTNTFSNSSGQGSDQGWNSPNYFAAPLATFVNAASSPFAASDNLLGSLWSKLIGSYDTQQAKGPPVVSYVQAVSPPLAGAIQPIVQH